jgi:phosphatidylethanolamine-binding protein (PEBP) family uncharacterized protein
MKLTSNFFEESSELPRKYTYDVDDVSPEIHRDNAPDGTKSFVLIYEDQDAQAGAENIIICFHL